MRARAVRPPTHSIPEDAAAGIRTRHGRGRDRGAQDAQTGAFPRTAIRSVFKMFSKRPLSHEAFSELCTGYDGAQCPTLRPQRSAAH